MEWEDLERLGWLKLPASDPICKALSEFCLYRNPIASGELWTVDNLNLIGGLGTGSLREGLHYFRTTKDAIQHAKANPSSCSSSSSRVQGDNEKDQNGDSSDEDSSKNGGDSNDDINPVNNQKAKASSTGREIAGPAASKKASSSRSTCCDLQVLDKYKWFDRDDLLAAGFVLADKADPDR